MLLVQRTPHARFMGGAWVFPGGAVSPEDGEGDAALRAAGIRELEEEAGIRIDGPEELVAFSRWITPEEVKIRYDTWFFLARLPDGAKPTVDGEEIVDARWYTPSDALEAGRADEILLVFPTIKHLEQLAGFRTASDAARPRPGPHGAPGPAAGRRLRRASSHPAARRARLRRLTKGTTDAGAPRIDAVRPPPDRSGHRTNRRHRPLAAASAGAQPRRRPYPGDGPQPV